MNSRRPFRSKPKSRFIAPITGVLVVLFFAGVTFFAVEPPRAASGISLWIARPLWRSGDASRHALDTLFAFFTPKATLVAENKKLSEELADARLRLLDRNRLFEENAELKTLLGRTVADRIVVAGVLSRVGIVPYDTLIIDAGVRERISVGDRVFAGSTVAIGSVAEVFSRTARVELFSAPHTTREGIISGLELPVTVEGQGGGNFSIRVPRGITIDSGTVVREPGIDGGILGVVEHVRAEEEDAFQSILFKLPVNIATLTTVTVERNDTDE